MEIKWLEDLLVLLEEKSFTRAAVRQHVTQPAFSRRIRLLEEWLGVPIVDRSTKPISLLPAALALEETVGDLVNRLYALRHSVQIQIEKKNQLTFIAQHSLAISRFPELISHIKKQYPDTSYRVIPGDNDECEALFLKSGEFLLCYETSQRYFDFSRHQVEKIQLGNDRLIPVCGSELKQRWADGYPQAGDNLPILMYQQNGFLAETLTLNCIPALLREFRVEVICESAFSASLKEMALANMGIAWLAGDLIRDEIASGQLCSLESVIGSEALSLVLYYRSMNENPDSRNIFEWLSRVTQVSSAPVAG